VRSLPLIDVAESWGLTIEAFNGQGARYLGMYRHGQSIAVGVKNLSTWAHELLHAADDRLGNLMERGQHWRSETVAELGGAVLLECLGYSEESDRGGCFQYVKGYAERNEIDVKAACVRVLKRTCQAVSLVLDSAQELRERGAAVA
jgi:hypothetical protein